MHPEQRPEDRSEDYPPYRSEDGYPPHPHGYAVPPDHPAAQPGPQPPTPGSYQQNYGYEQGSRSGAYPQDPYPADPYRSGDPNQTAGWSGTSGWGPGGYQTAAGPPAVPGGYPHDPGHPGRAGTFDTGAATYGGPATGGYGPVTGSYPAAPGTGQYPPVTGGHPTAEQAPPTGQYPVTGQYQYPATGTQPALPPAQATGQLRPAGELGTSEEYRRFRAGQEATPTRTRAAATAGTQTGAQAAVPSRAARTAGKRGANRRLRVAAAVILGATLMVGGGAFAAQSTGNTPFAGLLAGSRETTTTAPPADQPAQQAGQAPTATQPPTTAPPTTTPPQTTKPPERAERPAPASGRAGPGVRPNENNTGVPAGVKLRDRGDLIVDDAGATISGLDLGCVTVAADGVTIRNSRIRCGGGYPVRIQDGVTGVVLEDVEIDGGGNPQGTAVAFNNYTVRRAHIHNVGDGPRLGDNTRVEYSYIHDLVEGGGSHNDGVQSTGGSDIVVRGNRIDNPNSQTAAVLIGADLGDISNALVEGNWLNGGGYTVLAGGENGNTYSGIRIVDNVFGRDHAHGAMDIQDGVVWAGNRYADGEAITP